MRITETSGLNPDRNLGVKLVRATEAAAIRASIHVGKGDKNAADGAAVDAMRAFLSTVSFDGIVVIGEGEKTKLPRCSTESGWATEPGRAVVSPWIRSTART